MKVCFIANFYKTYFFHEIAKCLEKKGVEVYWVVVNRKLYDFLSLEYSSDRILYISKKNIKVIAQPVGDFKLNELVYGDRVLKYDIESGLKFLNHIQKPFYEFVQSNKIRFVFGEVTWAHEILFHRILAACKELDSRYLCPHTIRIPNGRFGFFVDEFQSELYQVVSKTAKNLDFDFEVKKPEYLAINDKKVHKSRTIRERISRIKRFISRENIDPLDPTVIASRWLSFRKHAGEEVNREAYRFVKRKPFTEKLQKNDYIFLALHKQPEASIDVIGRYYEDQFNNIVNVWRSLPAGWFLYIKEHSNAIGDRSIFFYRKIQALSNLVLLDERSDSHEIIKHSQAVVTVSGTVAYEAALLDKRSYTFGPCFFNVFSNCTRIRMDNLAGADCFSGALEGDSSDMLAKQFVIANSYSGSISDPVSDPRCLAPSNIEKVSNSFMEVIFGEH